MVGLDIGTTKVCAIIGELNGNGVLEITGVGICPSTGLRKGVVVNIEATLRAVSSAIEAAEMMSGREVRHCWTGIGGSHIDGNPWLLCVKNGTLDLNTGAFRQHERGDFISKMADVDYEPGADCPEWKKFVREIMNYKIELIQYLQAVCGWAVTGDTSEQTMFILYGSGANGKSTFLNTLMSLLGDYAIATPTETFMSRKGEQIGNDLARLRGARFVTTTETEQGKKIEEPLIKQITGNDRITARFLYGEYFNFQPTFKVFMATNHKPAIRGADHGIWRRIKLIPFTNRIPEEKQDKRLEEKLRKEASSRRRIGLKSALAEGTEE